MSLTGPFFLDGLVALTVVAFLGLVAVWPRLTARTPWHIVGRAVSLAVVNVLVLLTAATQLNSAYLFFAGWSDLEGAITGRIVQTGIDRGGAAAQAPNVAVSGQAAKVAVQVPPLNQPVGSNGLVKYTVRGPLSGLTGTVLVQLPRGYTSAAASTSTGTRR